MFAIAAYIVMPHSSANSELQSSSDWTIHTLQFEYCIVKVFESLSRMRRCWNQTNTGMGWLP